MTSYTFIDADSILFTSVYGDKTTDSAMKKRFRDKIELIKTQTWADEVFIAVKGKNNFRDELYPEYKKNRPELPSETRRRLNIMHSYALEQGAVQADGWEADDQVVSWAYEANQQGIDTVIAGIDKDLLQVPGNHYNYGGRASKPIAEEDRWHYTSEEEGRERFAAQLITGDVTDNIIAIKGHGPVKANKAVKGKSKKKMMEAIIELYKKQFEDKWEEKLILNSNLIYMRRWLDDEFDYKLWLKDDTV